jgi:hypothetical protein
MNTERPNTDSSESRRVEYEIVIVISLKFEVVRVECLMPFQRAPRIHSCNNGIYDQSC